MRTSTVTLLGLALAGAACARGGAPSTAEPGPPAPAAPATTPSETDRINEFFDEVFQRDLGRSPMRQTYLGIKADYGAWDDLSDEHRREDYELAKSDLERLHEFDYESLDRQARISYRLFEYETEREIEKFEWRFHSYPVNQMHGLHSWVPSFLMNFHRVDTVEDAEAYISRLEGLRPMFAQLEDNLVVRQEKGILPPKFVFPRVIDDCHNILSGAPFEDSDKASDLLSDFQRKVDELDVDDETRTELVARAERALVESVQPAYESLIALLERQSKQATTDHGIWKLPKGDEYYENALRWTTTTELSADEIHDLGLQEVERIHDEMRAIMKEVGFEGSLQEFFTFMREDDRFYLPDDDEGREAYLDRAREYLDGMRARLDELFITKPKAPIVVKRVEEYREESAGKAFYNGPTPDGSRPGIFYANLHDMRDMPTYQLEALVYHEGIPGHHMQISISYELEDIPEFRRFGGYTAYTEGWGLYSERIPKELGFYEDPYSDFGRLAMELWRAGRLVVDTGIHDRKWTRKEAIDWLTENTPNPRGDVVNAIERYIVMPSQATAYKIGMMRILELRERARAELGDDFDIRRFHEVTLTSGPVPLAVLEELVEEWIATQKA